MHKIVNKSVRRGKPNEGPSELARCVDSLRLDQFLRWLFDMVSQFSGFCIIGSEWGSMRIIFSIDWS